MTSYGSVFRKPTAPRTAGRRAFSADLPVTQRDVILSAPPLAGLVEPILRDHREGRQTATPLVRRGSQLGSHHRPTSGYIGQAEAFDFSGLTAIEPQPAMPDDAGDLVRIEVVHRWDASWCKPTCAPSLVGNCHERCKSLCVPLPQAVESALRDQHEAGRRSHGLHLLFRDTRRDRQVADTGPDEDAPQRP